MKLILLFLFVVVISAATPICNELNNSRSCVEDCNCGWCNTTQCFELSKGGCSGTYTTQAKDKRCIPFPTSALLIVISVGTIIVCIAIISALSGCFCPKICFIFCKSRRIHQYSQIN